MPHKAILTLIGLLFVCGCSGRKYSPEEQAFMDKLTIYRVEQHPNLSACQFAKPILAESGFGSRTSDGDLYGYSGDYETSLSAIKIEALDAQSDTVVIEKIKFPRQPPAQPQDYIFAVQASLFQCRQSGQPTHDTPN